MPTTKGMLAVPGARLHYEVRGTGPTLLLIPTGNGDAGPYTPLANALADRHTVITYDKRGYSRSPLDGRPDGGHRVHTDVDDAHRLLTELTTAPAHVLGGSSGAIVALALLERHPAQIRTLISHEPPLASILADAASWLRFYADLYATYQGSGAGPAMEIFRARMGMLGSTKPPEHAQLPPDQLADMLSRIRRNHDIWFETEVPYYPSYVPDLVALKSASDRLVLAGGHTSRDYFPYQPNTVLAAQLGKEIVHFPGGHVGYVTHPFEFADALTAVLGATNG
jgi:pimeloyl-ACP methyl ester carboxylesterase